MKKSDLMALYMMTNKGNTISVKEFIDYAKSMNDKKWIADKLMTIEQNTKRNKGKDFSLDLGANVLGNVITDGAIFIFKKLF
ncbi:hypothetical protein [Romboutsia sp.]|uniref:hypothetical protein n=1 Tax=Romboutsia sp. TaxID=1965302 RepID=UPI002B622FC5|nr:hypothetical protein [Romboutsia sp.]HSQ89379.1 hypothetical protein [Romboutsia sp.]